jgi:hypothetical protein
MKGYSHIPSFIFAQQRGRVTTEEGVLDADKRCDEDPDKRCDKDLARYLGAKGVTNSWHDNSSEAYAIIVTIYLAQLLNTDIVTRIWRSFWEGIWRSFWELEGPRGRGRPGAKMNEGICECCDFRVTFARYSVTLQIL